MDTGTDRALADRLGVPAPIVDTAMGLLETLLGTTWDIPDSDLDRITWWRWRNRVRMAHRASEVLAVWNETPTRLPPPFLVPLVAEAGDIGEPEARELWARLLCGGVIYETARHPWFRATLRGFSAMDSRAFNDWCVEFAEKTVDVEIENDASLQRLLAAGLLESPNDSLPLASDGRVYRSLRLSLLGRRLRDALLLA